MLKKFILYFIILSFTSVTGLFAMDSTLDASSMYFRDSTYVTFSFASDDNHSGYTFWNTDEATIRGRGVYDLVIDLNEHYPGGSVTFKTIFVFHAKIKEHQICKVPQGYGYIHQWTVSGSYYFHHYKGNSYPILMIVKFDDALLTSWSPTEYQAGPTMTLQNSREVDKRLIVMVHEPLKRLGIGNLDKRYADFAFTLTHMVEDSSRTGLIDLDRSGRFLERWNSEGSYSSTVKTIPLVNQKKPDLVPEFKKCIVHDNRHYVQIAVLNKGIADAGNSVTLVDFGSFGSVNVPTPSVPAGGYIIIYAEIPTTSTNCFNPDCEFKIIVDVNGQVDESKETNNTGNGVCNG